LALFGGGAILVASCGGGGGGSVSSTVSSPAYTGTYSGAAAQGDLATFTINGTNLSYHVWGSVFGNQSGTLTLTPWASEGGFFWKNDKNGVYLGVFKNVAVAYIDDLDATVVGIKEPSDPAQFNFTKTYAFIKVYKDSSGNWQREGGTISFDTANKIATVEYLNGTTETYNYQINATTKSVDLINQTTNETVAHIMHKLTDKGTELIVMDYEGGKGFALGREMTQINPDTNQTFKVYYYGESLTYDGDSWWGKASVYFDKNLNSWIADWEGGYTWDGKEYPDKGKTVIHFNTFCQYNDTSGEYDFISAPGVTCGCDYDEQTGQEDRRYCANGIVDPENQVLIDMGENDEDGQYVEIGGW
jgi:hypothetical protein